MNVSPATSPSSAPAIPLWRSATVLALGALTSLWIHQGATINAGNEAGIIPELPRVVAGFTGQDQAVSEGERALLPLDTVFAKKTYHFLDDEVACQIVLSGGEKRSIHRPEICLPGQGWSIRSAEPLPVELRDGRTLKVMHLTLVRPIPVGPDETRELEAHFLYWFVGRDRITPYHHERVLLSSWDRVLHSVNHRWAYVTVTTNVLKGFRPGAKNSAESLALARQFVADIVPYIHKPEVLKSLGQ